jgi:hypothetical protein
MPGLRQKAEIRDPAGRRRRIVALQEVCGSECRPPSVAGVNQGRAYLNLGMRGISPARMRRSTQGLAMLAL